MAVPPSVTRVKRDGVEFVSHVDRTKYTLAELERAALKDTAKFLRRRLLDELRKLPGMRRNRRLWSSTQYWVRRIETDLLIGFKHDSWYGARQEFGEHGQPSRGILRKVVYENINQIRIIQGQYLKHIEDENKALGLIDEEEEIGDEQGPETP